MKNLANFGIAVGIVLAIHVGLIAIGIQFQIGAIMFPVMRYLTRDRKSVV